MAAENYQKCLNMILHHEGGYVNHPKDPGGETNLGVTKRVYEEWTMKEGYDAKDMKDLTVEDVAPIYEKNYWGRMKCDSIPSGLDLCLFDFGVNAGTGRSAKFLQRMIDTTADGGIGPNTLKKLNEFISMQQRGVIDVINMFQDERQKYYESLPTFESFGKGWTRRVKETTASALKMVD
tara:strand:+ start:175 stop:711 length:537 start_codon:yes stop_codon:yes gene_type:complete